MFEASVSPDATIGCIDWLVYSQHSVWCSFDPTWTSDAGATVGQLAQKPCICGPNLHEHPGEEKARVVAKTMSCCDSVVTSGHLAGSWLLMGGWLLDHLLDTGCT